MAIQPEVLAQLAAAAYRDASDENRIVAPAGWTEIATYPGSGPSDDPVTGFSAVAYRGPDGDIVIAYAGTNVDSVLDNDWLKANAPAALGLYSQQVTQAAEFYWQVLSRPDVGIANKGWITFTGHSLGGGLASLMATYFDRPATTFDSAPFELSAFVASALDQYAKQFADAGIADPSWQQYRAAQSAGTLAQLFRQREARVSHVFVTNEALAALRLEGNAIVGSERALDSGTSNANASGKQLHSMLLAWAMLSKNDFAVEIRKLPRLFGLIDDGQLFGRKRTTEEQDFLTLLLKFEHDTAMLTQFTGDLKDVSGKFSAASATVGDALIALTIAHYYRMSNGFDAQLGEAVKNIAGGLEMTMGGAGWSGRGFSRAYELLREMVDLLSGGSADLAGVWQKERLVVADGTSLSFLDASGKRDLVLGGTAADSIALGAGDDYAGGLGGVDELDGGSGDDVLDGGSDDDVLDGGPGNDILIGGAGDDVYRFAGAWGRDTIEDSGGDGRLTVDGAELPQGLKVPGQDGVWVSADGLFRYVFAPYSAGTSTGTLYVLRQGRADTIAIHDHTLGQLGITLSDAPARFDPPEVQLIAPAGAVPYELVGDPAGVASRDELIGSGGVDLLHGRLGDDRLDGGGNGDILVGGLGADRISGGDGSDAIHGGGHMPGVTRAIEEPPSDQSFVWLNDGPGWYAGLTTQGTLSVGGALFGYTAATGGPNDADDGDLIDAGPGSDWVYGDAGDDVVNLGAGDDIANGGQGADIIVGGEGVDLIMGDYIDTGGYLFLISEHGSDVLIGDGGADVIEGDGGGDRIYGGADNDVLWGDDTFGLPASYHGDDVLDGGSGNDRLMGQGGGDELHGGVDDDLLFGDDAPARLAGEFHGGDHLDGADGNDQQQGQGGADMLLGGAGNDALFGDDGTAVLAGRFHGADHLDGEDGDDYLEGHGGSDELFGGAGADTLFGDSTGSQVDPAFQGDDYLDGEADNDLLIGGGGKDALFGGAGNDQLQGDDV
jgi:Ca2+-binding RTX toxin-like protein